MMMWNWFDTDYKNEWAIFTRLISLSGHLLRFWLTNKQLDRERSNLHHFSWAHLLSGDLKVPMHQNSWQYFYWLILKTVKSQEEGFLPFVDICFCSRDMSFQSVENLKEKWEKRFEHLCPFNKNCDVTSRTCIYTIFKSDLIQTSLVRIK